MLRILRKKMKGILIAVIIVIIPAFIFFYGAGRSRGRQPQAVVVAKVNGQKIDYRQFYNAYQRAKGRRRSGYWDEEKERQLRKETLDGLIREILLPQEAKRRRIKVTDQEVFDQISSIPALQREGKFDEALYLSVLSYQGLSPERFEAQMRDDLMVKKLVSQVTEGVEVSEEELREEYIKRNEEVRVKYLLFKKEDFKKDLKVEEKELKDYLEENREELKVPEEVNVQYVLIDPKEKESQVEINDDEIANYYQENIEEFKHPEEIRAGHILIKLGSDADEEAEAKKKAEEILESLKEGEDFATLAKKYSDDPGSKEKGGDLGFFPRGRMVPAFEEAAFSLKVGELSQLVKTPFGYHIIKLEERKEAYTTSLEEVRSQIQATLKAKRADEMAREEAEDLASELLDKADWERMVKERKLKVKETGLFARGEAIKDIGWAPQFSRETFTLEEDEVSQTIKTPKGYAIFVLKDRRESHLPELDEVREKVEEKVKDRKATELAKSKAEECLTKLREGATFEEVAGDFSLKVKDSGLFSRGQYIEGIGPSEDFSEAAFALKEAEVSDPIETRPGFCLLQLEEKEGIDEEKYNEEKEKFKENLLPRKKWEAYNKWYQSLRSEARVWTNPEVIN